MSESEDAANVVSGPPSTTAPVTVAAKRKPQKKQAKAKKKKSSQARGTITKRDRQRLKAGAEQIAEYDSAIKKLDKMSTPIADKAGAKVVWLKEELKRLKIKGKFEVWIEKECGIKYKRAYNYMKVHLAAKDNPALLKLGLTEVYIILGLVTRGAKSKESGSADANVSPTAAMIASASEETSDHSDGNEDKAPSQGSEEEGADVDNAAETAEDDLGEDNDEDGDADSGDEGITIAGHAVHHAATVTNVNVIEIDGDDWEDTLLNIFADTDTLGDVLANGGLLIRLKQNAEGSHV